MTKTMSIEAVIQFMLTNPSVFPGTHNKSQARTTPGLGPLDCHMQAITIFKCACKWMAKKLEEGKACNWRGLGCFAFSHHVSEGHPDNACGFHLNQKSCFEPADALKKCLGNHRDVENRQKQNGSIYQQGQGTVFVNSIPIAANCYYRADVVESTLNSIAAAIRTAVAQKHNVSIDFSFSRMKLMDGKVKYVAFAKDYNAKVQETATKWPKRALQTAASPYKTTKDHWTKNNICEDYNAFYITTPDAEMFQKLRTQTKKIGATGDFTSC